MRVYPRKGVGYHLNLPGLVPPAWALCRRKPGASLGRRSRSCQHGGAVGARAVAEARGAYRPAARMRASPKPSWLAPPPPASGSGVRVWEASCRWPADSARAGEDLEGGATRVQPAQHRRCRARLLPAGVPREVRNSCESTNLVHEFSWVPLNQGGCT
jgi:hypothetical protein